MKSTESSSFTETIGWGNAITATRKFLGFWFILIPIAFSIVMCLWKGWVVAVPTVVTGSVAFYLMAYWLLNTREKYVAEEGRLFLLKQKGTDRAVRSGLRVVELLKINSKFIVVPYNKTPEKYIFTFPEGMSPSRIDLEITFPSVNDNGVTVFLAESYSRQNMILYNALPKRMAEFDESHFKFLIEQAVKETISYEVYVSIKDMTFPKKEKKDPKAPASIEGLQKLTALFGEHDCILVQWTFGEGQNSLLAKQLYPRLYFKDGYKEPAVRDAAKTTRFFPYTELPQELTTKLCTEKKTHYLISESGKNNVRFHIWDVKKIGMWGTESNPSQPFRVLIVEIESSISVKEFHALGF